MTVKPPEGMKSYTPGDIYYVDEWPPPWEYVARHYGGASQYDQRTQWGYYMSASVGLEGARMILGVKRADNIRCWYAEAAYALAELMGL